MIHEAAVIAIRRAYTTAGKDAALVELRRRLMHLPEQAAKVLVKVLRLPVAPSVAYRPAVKPVLDGRLRTKLQKLTLAFALICIVDIHTASSDDLTLIGKGLFIAKCNGCHALPEDNMNSIGPSLHGIVGRHAGTYSGFEYSNALRLSNIVWAEPRIDAFLTSPQSYIGPDHSKKHDKLKMEFRGIESASDRRAIIAYLRAN
ncbi:MAG: hypothetical protein WCJ64_24845 [Rhodospirillaceae bacterium]